MIFTDQAAAGAGCSLIFLFPSLPFPANPSLSCLLPFQGAFNAFMKLLLKLFSVADNPQ